MWAVKHHHERVVCRRCASADVEKKRRKVVSASQCKPTAEPPSPRTHSHTHTPMTQDDSFSHIIFEIFSLFFQKRQTRNFGGVSFRANFLSRLLLLLALLPGAVGRTIGGGGRSSVGDSMGGAVGVGLEGSLLLLGADGVLDEEVEEEGEEGDHVEEEDAGGENRVAVSASVEAVGGLEHHGDELGHLHQGDVALDENNLLDTEGGEEVIAIHDNVNERIQGSRVVG